MTPPSLYISSAISPVERTRARTTRTGTGTGFTLVSGSLHGQRRTRILSMAIEEKVPSSRHMLSVPEGDAHHFAFSSKKTRVRMHNFTAKGIDVQAASGASGGDHRWSELIPPDTALTFAVVWDPEDGLCTFSDASLCDMPSLPTSLRPAIQITPTKEQSGEGNQPDERASPSFDDSASQTLTIDLIASALPNLLTATTFNNNGSGFPRYLGVPPSVALRSSVGTNCALDAYMSRRNTKDGKTPAGFERPYHYYWTTGGSEDDEGFYETPELRTSQGQAGYDGSVLDHNLNSSFTTTTTSTSRYIHLSTEVLASSNLTLNFDANAHCNGCAAPKWSWDYVDAMDADGFYDFETPNGSPLRKTGEKRKLRKKRPSNHHHQSGPQQEQTTAAASTSTSSTLVSSPVSCVGSVGHTSMPFIDEIPASPEEVLIRSRYNHECPNNPSSDELDDDGDSNIQIHHNIWDPAYSRRHDLKESQPQLQHRHCATMRIPASALHVVRKVKSRTLRKCSTRSGKDGGGDDWNRVKADN